jgi:hypothetical protein
MLMPIMSLLVVVLSLAQVQAAEVTPWPELSPAERLLERNKLSSDRNDF